MKAVRWGAAAYRGMGELTDDQLRQIAASRAKGISDSVKAAEAQGHTQEVVSAATQELASEVAALRTDAARQKASSRVPLWVWGAAAFGGYLLLRRKKRRPHGA